MEPVAVTTTVARPIEEVYDHLAVLANHEAFTDHMLTDWSTDGPPAGPGAHARVKAKGVRGPVDITVFEDERPRYIAERSVSGDGARQSKGTYFLEPAGEGGTNVRFELAFEKVPRAERLLLPLLKPVLKRGNQRAMERLREQLER